MVHGNVKHGRDITPKQCLNCGGKKKKGAVKYCSIACKSEAMIRNKVEGWLSGTVEYASEYGAPDFIRNYVMKLAGNKCSQCSWAEVHPITGRVPLNLDHIDGNVTNNKIENLRVLCPNCHSLTDNYGILNRGNSRRKYKHGNSNRSQGQLQAG